MGNGTSSSATAMQNSMCRTNWNRVETMSEECREIEIDPCSPLPLPGDIVEHRSSGGALVAVAPESVTWCVLTGELPATLFKKLCAGRTPEAAMQELACSAGPAATEKAIQQVLVELDDKAFLSSHHSAPFRRYEHLKVNLTDECNLRCAHCYRFCAKARPGELPVDDWGRVVCEHASAGGTTISVAGGEPLCRLDDCLTLLTLAHDNGLQSVLLTNGTLVSPSVAQRLSAVVDEVQVSLDGPTKEVSESVRGVGTWDRTIRAIHELVRRQVLVRIAMTPLPATLGAFEQGICDFLDYVTATFGDNVVVQLGGIVLEGRNVAGCTGCAARSWDGKIAALRRKAFGDDYHAMLDAALLEPHVRRATCGYAASFFVEPDGTVLPCDLCPQTALGTVAADPRSELEERLRSAAHRVSVDASPVCRECDLRYICGGTCRIEDEQSHGDPLQPSCDRSFKQGLIDRLADMNKYRYEIDEP